MLEWAVKIASQERLVIILLGLNPRSPFLRHIDITLLLWGAVASAAIADTRDDPLSEHYFFDDVPVVLSATRLTQPISETPAAITIIDRELIEASGAVEIVDLLRLVPGFQIGTVNGNKFTATYHGLSDRFARDMQVLIDGRSIYDPGYGGVPWADLPLAIDNIDRIEVIRGPNAAAYGSNSFSGVINIITNHPALQQGTFFRGTIGNNGDRRGMLRYAGSAGFLDDMSYRLTLGYNENDGYDTRHDSSDTYQLGFRGDYRWSSKDTIMLQLGFSDGQRQDGFPGDPVQPERDIFHTRHFQQIRWNRITGNESEFSLQFYHNYQKVEDPFETPMKISAFFGITPAQVPLLFGGQPDQTILLGYGFISNRYDLEFEHILKPADNWRLVWGAGLRYDSVKGPGPFNRPDTVSRQQVRGFFNAEWRLSPDLIVNLGTMFERFSGSNDYFSPRIAVNYHLNPDHSLRASASRALRMPTLFEQYADVTMRFHDGSLFDQLYKTVDDLRAESMRSFEIGYVGRFPRQALTLDLKLFRDQIRHRISDVMDPMFPAPVPATATFQYKNSGEVDINGLELQLRFHPTRQSLFHLGYSLAHASGKELRAINPDNYRPLNPTVPSKTLSTLFSYRFPDQTRVSVAYYYLDDIRWLYEGDPIEAYHRWDLRLARTFRLADSETDIALIAQNISGDHLDFQFENRADRRIFLSVGVQFR